MKKTTEKKRRAPTRHAGICGDAEALGVHRVHLYLCLVGKRESKSLMKRYKALRENQQPTKKGEPK